MTATDTFVPELVHVPPSTLFVDGNIRRAATLNPDLIESIRDHGVLQPIVAVRNSEGGLLVRLGQRRTLAAVAAGDRPVPVYVAGPADSDEADRIVDQWVENEHREPLTTADRMATELTLDHAAAIAEFDDLPDVAAELVQVAVEQPGSFTFRAQRMRDERARHEKIAAEHARLEAAGVRLIDSDTVGYDSPTRATRKLSYLEAPGGKQLNGTTHKKCPGHAAYLDRDGAAVYVCTDWKGNGHTGKYDTTGTSTSSAATSAKDQEKAKAERRAVIDNNKAWPTAETVRRDWLRGFLAAKTLPKGAAGFLAVELVHGDVLRADYMVGHHDGKPLAAELLGYANVTELGAAAANATDVRAGVIALAVVLAKYEANTDREHWRTVRATTRRYLEFLEANGYDLADVEKLAAGRKPGRRTTKAAK